MFGRDPKNVIDPVNELAAEALNFAKDLANWAIPTVLAVRRVHPTVARIYLENNLLASGDA